MHLHFNDSERKKWQDPEAVLESIGLKPGSVFIDVGCGSGFFALPAARIVGKTGKVYGLDIDARAIAELKEQGEKEGLANLRLSVGRAEETVLCEGCADIVFFGMALHDFQDAARVLDRSRTMVKFQGRLVNLDWKKKPTPFGPPLRIRFAEEKAAGLIREAGFIVEDIRDSGPYHYLVIGKPSASGSKT
jgi:ubiquinone/menaquinone biosynthesis C-methylase UbiE